MWQTRYWAFKSLQATTGKNVSMLGLCDGNITGKGGWKEMNLYLISQDVNWNYDTYDSAVVAARSKKEARMTHPRGIKGWDGKCSGKYSSWVSFGDVNAELIGVAKKGATKGVVLASYNAG